ncbi:MAG: energy-coupling factor transporter transmembrane component T family protein [Promethearchaeota archaeon]
MSLNLLKGFEFRRKETFFHALDPRTKLVITITYSTLALLFNNLIILALLTLTLVPFIINAKILQRWLTSIKGLTFIILFILILNTWLNSLDFALSMCIRIILLLTSFSLFFMTVHPDDLALSLLTMKVPFSFTFTLSLATRFMPTLATEAQNIIDAQRSRGLELERGSLIKRVKNMIPILIPLIINSIKRAFSIAEALESKAFGAVKERTFLHELHISKRDVIIITIVILGAALLVVLNFYNMLPDFFFFKISKLFPNL